MAIEDGLPSVGGSPDVGQIRRYGSTIVRLIAVTVLLLGWLAIWGVVLRLHLLMGDFVSAGIVGVTFVVPAIGGFVLYLRDSLPPG